MIYKNTISSSEDMHLAVIALSHWLLTVYYAFGQTGIVHFIELEFVWNYFRLLGIRYQLVQLGGFWPEARKCHTSHKYRLPPFKSSTEFYHLSSLQQDIQLIIIIKLLSSVLMTGK